MSPSQDSPKVSSSRTSRFSCRASNFSFSLTQWARDLSIKLRLAQHKQNLRATSPYGKLELTTFFESYIPYMMIDTSVPSDTVPNPNGFAGSLGRQCQRNYGRSSTEGCLYTILNDRDISFGRMLLHTLYCHRNLPTAATPVYATSECPLWRGQLLTSFPGLFRIS